jgi:hypothetical protein
MTPFPSQSQYSFRDSCCLCHIRFFRFLRCVRSATALTPPLVTNASMAKECSEAESKRKGSPRLGVLCDSGASEFGACAAGLDSVFGGTQNLGLP